jgi:hypothetical protein
MSIKLNSKPHCPSCDKCLDGATNSDMSQRQPRSGDISICVYCLSINMFKVDGDDVSLMGFSKEQLEDFKERFPDEFEMINNYRTAIAEAKAKSDLFKN